MLDHWRHNARELPWRATRDPWAILVSEVMLQQTQIPRVVERYGAFLSAFPDPASLAGAPLARALALWKGLGYNRRCLALHRAAGRIVAGFGGRVPRSVTELETLPGVGPYTARAVAAFAFDEPVAFIETNIRRTFIHWFFPRAARVPDRDILPLVELTMDRRRPGRWFNALMDYGAWLAGEVPNPNRRSAHHARQAPFEGSRRQLRGRILALLVDGRSRTSAGIAREIGVTEVGEALRALVDEGFLSVLRGSYRVADTSGRGNSERPSR